MAQIIRDACQMTMFSYVSPSSRGTAEELSKTLGSMTIQSGSISSGGHGSTSLNMIGRPLMTPDEIINMPQGTFVLMKAGKLPAKNQLELYWNYSKKVEPFTERLDKLKLENIRYLTGDKIRSYVTRQKAKLTKGMFD